MRATALALVRLSGSAGRGVCVDERPLPCSLVPAPNFTQTSQKPGNALPPPNRAGGSWALSPVSQRRKYELLLCREHAARCRKTVVIHATHRERNRRSALCQLTPADIRNGLLIRWSGVRFPGGPRRDQHERDQRASSRARGGPSANLGPATLLDRPRCRTRPLGGW